MAEDTMFLDVNGEPILLGDIVRAPITFEGFQRVHGAWADYEIRKAPGGYVLSYLASEKGSVLPRGYTAGFMADSLPPDDEKDLKSLVFAVVPIRVTGWKRMPQEPSTDG